MSNNFGYLDLILLAMIAGFIILRLRNVLGRKTGHEGKVVSNLSEKKFEEFKKTIKLKKQPTEFDTNQKKQFLKGAEIAYETIINSCIAVKRIKLIVLRAPIFCPTFIIINISMAGTPINSKNNMFIC